MTKYRLKDQELQEKLCALDKGFPEALQHAVEKVAKYGEDAVLVSFGPSEAIHVDLFLTEIEEIPEYDPKKWNEYPEVTPPEGVWMRVEDDTRGGYKAKFSGTTWYFGFESMDNIVRFRPWEDE